LRSVPLANHSRILISDCRYVGHVLDSVHIADTEKIWLGHVKCRRCERSLDQCSHNTWGYHSCYHQEVVSIACYDRNTTAATATTTTTAATTTATVGSLIISGYLMACRNCDCKTNRVSCLSGFYNKAPFSHRWMASRRQRYPS